jgi:hypothetical protein
LGKSFSYRRMVHWLTEIFKADKSWIVIDVRANICQTLLKLKSINKEICYNGFGPNPACVNYLTLLIEKNRFINTTLSSRYTQ